MTRSSTLLPALVVLFGLAGASLAMADDASSTKTTASPSVNKTTDKSTSQSNSCDTAPMYERPDYCHPRGG
ncbi:hypothetical protein [Hypericibacter sp.]|uniref:hypothetical protein n=1 Tax=Hypericibacter sp. TaxID=2705401 RepID=UPI003D6D0C7B